MALPAPAYGSTILITGASSGIGADLARQLAERGYNVTLTARRRDRLEELAEELREAHGIHVDVESCDLGAHAARSKLAGKLLSGEREVVGVCNNAGFGNLGRFLELSGTGVSVTSLCPGFTRTEFEQAAGAEDAASKFPGFTWMESEDVARQGIEGMLAGRRTVVPGVVNKVVSTSGRFTPRTVLLPLIDRVSKSA